MENSQIITVLNDINSKPISNEERYEEMIRFIHRQIDIKKVEINQKVRDRFGIDHKILTFDEGYFEGGHYNGLFVCVAALADIEVYSWLEHAYNITHNDTFSEEILEAEVARTEKRYGPLFIIDFNVFTESGDTAVIYAQRGFKTHGGRSYDINHYYTEKLDDGRIEVRFVIEFANFEIFTAILADDERFRRAVSFPEPKNNDELYLLAEDQLKDQVSEFWDSK